MDTRSKEEGITEGHADEKVNVFIETVDERYPERIQEYQSFLDTLPEKVKKDCYVFSLVFALISKLQGKVFCNKIANYHCRPGGQML